MFFQSSSEWSFPLLKVQVRVLGEGAGDCDDEHRRQEEPDEAQEH